jgi:ribosomal protein L12E/L44/L45/RPP1/RPP2
VLESIRESTLNEFEKIVEEQNVKEVLSKLDSVVANAPAEEAGAVTAAEMPRRIAGPESVENTENILRLAK